LPYLSQGTSGAAVEILQRFLVIDGYQRHLGTNPVNGQFGAKTKAAVQAFQGDHYLVKDGAVE
jgi:peptidoglycan hydrolase-like protein with peptidoglycan-binding domain